MSDIILQLLWVAAHHGLRRRELTSMAERRCWLWVHDITATLGNPPAPGSP